MGCLNQARRFALPFGPRGSIWRRFEREELGARARASSRGREGKGEKKQNLSSFLPFVFLSLVNQMQPRFSGACNSWRGGNICRSRRMRIPQVKPAFSGILKFSFVAASLYRGPTVRKERNSRRTRATLSRVLVSRLDVYSEGVEKNIDTI